ncbi:MAG: hypothetical protein ACXADY_11915 [Candidatus Hodarchaeales archaeon]|jgi:hypothetical protein
MSFISRLSGQKEIRSLEDFQERLELLISRIEQEYKDSTSAEQEYQQEYNEKLSKLDFSGSKNAVEDGRRQLTKSLDLDSQLEFLKNIRRLSRKIPENRLQTQKKLESFRLIVKQIFDHKKISSSVSRRIVLKQFRKFVPSSDDFLLVNSTSDEDTFNEDVEKILKEVAEGGTEDSSSIDSEVEKILEEIKKKKNND